MYYFLDIMKVSGQWVLYLALATALMFLDFSQDATSLSIADMVFNECGSSRTFSCTNRRLKENGYNLSTSKRSNAHKVNLEDYHPIDPVPSSKASIKPGPIEHGTPLNPYIPKPSVPSPGHPKNINGGLV